MRTLPPNAAAVNRLVEPRLISPKTFLAKLENRQWQDVQRARAASSADRAADDPIFRAAHAKWEPTFLLLAEAQ